MDQLFQMMLASAIRFVLLEAYVDADYVENDYVEGEGGPPPEPFSAFAMQLRFASEPEPEFMVEDLQTNAENLVLMTFQEAARFAESVEPIYQEVDTKQAFAAGLRKAAKPLVTLTKPKTEEDMNSVDKVVSIMLEYNRIAPESEIGLFSRDRVKEAAKLGNA